MKLDSTSHQRRSSLSAKHPTPSSKIAEDTITGSYTVHDVKPDHRAPANWPYGQNNLKSISELHLIKDIRINSATVGSISSTDISTKIDG